jgi:hypothetical protein
MTKILAAWRIHQRAKPSGPAPTSLAEFVSPPHFPKETLTDPISNQPFYYNTERGCIDHAAQADQPWASSRTEVLLPQFPKTAPKPSGVPSRTISPIPPDKPTKQR